MYLNVPKFLCTAPWHQVHWCPQGHPSPGLPSGLPKGFHPTLSSPTSVPLLPSHTGLHFSRLPLLSAVAPGWGIKPQCDYSHGTGSRVVPLCQPLGSPADSGWTSLPGNLRICLLDSPGSAPSLSRLLRVRRCFGKRLQPRTSLGSQVVPGRWPNFKQPTHPSTKKAPYLTARVGVRPEESCQGPGSRKALLDADSLLPWDGASSYC